MKVSPQSDLLIQTPFKENFFGVYAFGSGVDNQIQKVFYTKIEFGIHPGPVEIIHLKNPLYSEFEMDNCFVKMGRYSDEDVLANRRNYVAVVNVNAEDDRDDLVSLAQIR